VYKFLGGGGGDAKVDSAIAFASGASGSGNAEVALLSPGGVPRVLDDPVHSGRRISSVSDKGDSVVGRRAGAGSSGSGGTSDDASSVAEKDIRVHGDGKGSMLNKVGLNNVHVSAEGSPFGNLGSHSGVRRRASTIHTSVRVLSFSGESRFDDISIGKPGKTTTAAAIAETGLRSEARFGAIHDFLLGERNELASAQKVLALNVGDS